MPRPDRSRAALMDSAAMLFRRQGYAATGVNQILETAQVKAGMSAGLSSDQRDGCPIEPIATESVNASQQVCEASARVFGGWCLAVADRLRADGWPDSDADQTALAVIALLEGALILSRITGGTTALDAAKAAARTLLSPASGAHGVQPSC